MSTRNSGRASILYLIVLLILIYAFRGELFSAGVRLYTKISPDPRAERLLGDYYAKKTNRNIQRSTQFYANSLKQYKEQLASNTTSAKQKAFIKYQIGLFHACGKGVPQDLGAAKIWYADALKSAAEADKERDKVNEQVRAEINQALANSSRKPEHCVPLTEKEFVQNILGTFTQ